MDAIRPAQLPSVYFDRQPSVRIRKRGANNLSRDHCSARTFDRFGIRLLEQEHPRAAFFQRTNQLLDPFRIGPRGDRRILRIELLERAIRIDPVVEIARRLYDQLAQVVRDLRMRRGA